MSSARGSFSKERPPNLPIGPVLDYYGGEPVLLDRGWYAYKCPFHGDSSASASLNTVENVFVCHGCEVKGNAPQLIMKHEGIPYGEAYKRAEEITRASGIDIPRTSGRGSSSSGGSGNQRRGRPYRTTRRSA